MVYQNNMSYVTVIGVAAGPGHSKMCLMCDHVHGPSGCMTHSHCPDVSWVVNKLYTFVDKFNSY